LNRTPFHRFHEQQGAHFVDFAGWQMPIRYGSIIEEHQQVRAGAGLFDVSHMGRIKFTARHARRFLERILTRRISVMKVGTCRYALICNNSGGVLDDVIVYRFEDDWMLVVNALNREKLLKHFEQVKADEQMIVQIDDITQQTAMIACQGPKVMELVSNFSREIPALKNYSFCEKTLLVLKMTISRTGYTGEDGIEIIMGAKTALMAIKMLLKDGGEHAATMKPAGLGARDSLRLEAGMPLYGHELDEQTDPLAAGLGFAVNLDKGDEADGPTVPRFIGQDALVKIAALGPNKVLAGLKLECKRTPRQGAEVLCADDTIGSVTSGCLSPTLGYPIAMAYVKPGAVDVGDVVAVMVGKKAVGAEVVKLPFYKRGR